MSSTRAELARVLFVVVACALVWMAQHDRWTWKSWHEPTQYAGDAMEILARIKAASEGDAIPLLPQRMSRLGAPLRADWNAYPAPEKLQLLAMGVVARVRDIYFASNLGLLVAITLSACSFYWVARRWLRCRWEWAVAGALLFSFAYPTFHRGLAHFSFVFTAGIPLGLLACWLVARSHRLAWKDSRAVVCIGSGALLGMHNTYYLYFWLPLMGWALIAQWVGPRRHSNLQIGLAAIAAGLFVFFLLNFEYWFHRQTGDAVPLLERNYGGTERYALKPVEMLIPPAFHRWEPFAFFGARYTRWSEWRGEVFLPYLGLVGIAALLWLTVGTVRRLLLRRAPTGAALTLAWIVGFAAIGGLTNVLALFAEFNAFRATSRISIFIAATLLLFLCVRLSRLTTRWPAAVRIGAAALMACVGLLDQLPRPTGATARGEIATMLSNDRVFAGELEAALPEGAAVFQLPVVGFPEVQPPWRLGDYEHFRPYLNTTSLRFSYGVPKYRPRGRWQQDLPLHDARALVRELESLGFSALYVNRKGFEDGGAQLLRELAALGYQRSLASRSGQQVVVHLHPSANPVLPLARTFTFGRGWHRRLQNGVRWAYDDEAVLLYDNPTDKSLRARVTATLRAPDARQLVVQLNGERIAQPTADADGEPLAFAGLTLRPGINTITVTTEAPALRGAAGSLQSFGIAAVNLEVRAQ